MKFLLNKSIQNHKSHGHGGKKNGKAIKLKKNQLFIEPSVDCYKGNYIKMENNVSSIRRYLLIISLQQEELKIIDYSSVFNNPYIYLLE